MELRIKLDWITLGCAEFNFLPFDLFKTSTWDAERGVTLVENSRLEKQQ